MYSQLIKSQEEKVDGRKALLAFVKKAWEQSSFPKLPAVFCPPLHGKLDFHCSAGCRLPQRTARACIVRHHAARSGGSQ